MKARRIGFMALTLLLTSACSGGNGGPAEQTSAESQVNSMAGPDAARLASTNRQVEITEWLVPFENTRPRDPFVDPSGRVWFCGQAGAYVAYLVPETGQFRKFDLADKAGPHNLIVDDGGYVWYAANTLPYIGRLNPETAELKKFPMPEPVVDPHTLVFDSHGNIWFTAQRGNHVARLDTETGEVKYVAAPVSQARPYGIKVDANDLPWIVLFGTNKLATVDPATMQMTTFDLPRAGARPRRLELTDDGMVWYVDYAEGMLGRFNPKDRAFSEWPLPGGANSRPYGTALDDNETIWIAEGGTPNRLVAFDTKTEQFRSVDEIPNSKGAIRHMYFHPITREIWFGEDSNYIARARVP